MRFPLDVLIAVGVGCMAGTVTFWGWQPKYVIDPAKSWSVKFQILTSGYEWLEKGERSKIKPKNK